MHDATGTMTRRNWLGWAATGAAGLLLPTVVRPAPKVFDMGRSMGRPELRGMGGPSLYLVTKVKAIGGGYFDYGLALLGSSSDLLVDRKPSLTFDGRGAAFEVGDVIEFSGSGSSMVGRVLLG